MTPRQLVQTLQLTDSAFPVGAFAYSDGLETAVAGGAVRSADDLESWAAHYVDGLFVPCEGPAVVQTMKAAGQSDRETIRRIDEELTALKPSAAGRAASLSIGRRLLTAYTAVCEGAGLPPLPAAPEGCNAVVAYGLVYAHAGIEPREAALAYGYSRISGILSASMRVMPVGQQQVQTMLARILRRLPEAVDDVIRSEGPLRAFSPLLDIQQMNHRYVYSRLFRS